MGRMEIHAQLCQLVDAVWAPGQGPGRQAKRLGPPTPPLPWPTPRVAARRNGSAPWLVRPCVTQSVTPLAQCAFLHSSGQWWRDTCIQGVRGDFFASSSVHTASKRSALHSHYLSPCWYIT